MQRNVKVKKLISTKKIVSVNLSCVSLVNVDLEGAILMRSNTMFGGISKNPQQPIVELRKHTPVS